MDKGFWVHDQENGIVAKIDSAFMSVDGFSPQKREGERCAIVLRSSRYDYCLVYDSEEDCRKDFVYLQGQLFDYLNSDCAGRMVGLPIYWPHRSVQAAERGV